MYFPEMPVFYMAHGKYGDILRLIRGYRKRRSTTWIKILKIKGMTALKILII